VLTLTKVFRDKAVAVNPRIRRIRLPLVVLATALTILCLVNSQTKACRRSNRVSSRSRNRSGN
jgi:hypothetical protein